MWKRHTIGACEIGLSRGGRIIALSRHWTRGHSRGQRPNYLRKVTDWYAAEQKLAGLRASEAKHRKSRYSSKRIAVGLLVTALFGLIVFTVETTEDAVLSTILIFVATLIAAFTRYEDELVEQSNLYGVRDPETGVIHPYMRPYGEAQQNRKAKEDY
jgi:hypothetical protein